MYYTGHEESYIDRSKALEVLAKMKEKEAKVQKNLKAVPIVNHKFDHVSKEEDKKQTVVFTTRNTNMADLNEKYFAGSEERTIQVLNRAIEEVLN